MILHEKIPLSHEGNEYEIRVYYDDRIINVVAFQNNYPVNGFRHQIKLPKKCNIKATLEKGIANGLITTTKEDIVQKRWEGIKGLIEIN
jgi:hypothetical protein